MSHEAVLSLTSTPRSESVAICLTSSRAHVMQRRERNIQALMDGIPSYDCHRYPLNSSVPIRYIPKAVVLNHNLIPYSRNEFESFLAEEMLSEKYYAAFRPKRRCFFTS